MQAVFILAAICLQLGRVLANGYCYSTEGNPYRWYATKTNYDTVWDSKIMSHLNTSKIEGCEPSVFYLIARHGSRYTSTEDIVMMADILPGYQQIVTSDDSQLCEADKEALRSWTMRMKEEDDKDLAETGWDELRKMAKRFALSIPGLMAVPYDDKWFHFRHTQTARTKDSASAFVEGLFGSVDGVNIEEQDKSEDWVLYFYKNCEKYKSQVSGNLKEYEDFLRGSEIKTVIKRIQSRTGLLKNDTDMNEEEILEKLQILYRTCSFEYQVYSDSPWCAVLEQRDLKVLEYAEDVGYYWEDGYGDKINYQQTCDLMREIVYYLRLDVNERPPTQKVVARFGHSGVINMLSARLGLYKDDSPLTAEGYQSNKNRKWRTSFHCPMSANIAFIRYNCSANEDKVAVYANEELITLPISGCSDGICPVSAIIEEWLPSTKSCDLHKICDLPVGTAAVMHISLTLGIISLFGIFCAGI